MALLTIYWGTKYRYYGPEAESATFGENFNPCDHRLDAAYACLAAPRW